MKKALLIGITILAVPHMLWLLGALTGSASSAFGLLIWASATIAGAVVSYLAPSKKLVAGGLMCIPAAALAALTNAISEASGHAVDFSGVQGAFLVLGMSLAVSLVLCSIGALGSWLFQRYATP